MNTDRFIIRKKLNELVDAAPFFQKITGIDVNHIPEQYGDDVTNAQKLLEEYAEIVIIYKTSGIESVSENEVIWPDAANDS